MDALAHALLTYLLHSTVLLGAAATACVALGERRLALQEALLRAALVGGFLTAGLQAGLGITPLGGSVRVPDLTRSAEAPRDWAVATPLPTVPPGRRVEAPAASPAPRWQARVVLGPAVPSWLWQWPVALAGLWSVLSAVAVLRLGVAARRLSRLLRDRRPLRPGDVAPGTDAIGRALGLVRPVRLSAAPRLSVPLATGVLRPEVCLPPRAVSQLGADERLALCAHEIAHLARRDPAWILFARLVECAAPLQPLNGWARHRLQDLAECLSDDLAVSASGRSAGLARSLVDVASWTLGEPVLVPAPAAGAFSARSRLGHRVERLMDPRRTLEQPRRVLLPLAVAAVLSTALVTPVVSSGNASPGQQSPTPAPAAGPAPQAAPAPPARPAPQAVPPPKPALRPLAEADADRAAAEHRLQALTRQLEARARAHEAEMREIEKQIEALVARVKPDEAALERMSREIEAAAADLAASVAADLEAGDEARRSERTAEAARRMAELKEQMHAATKDIRIPEAELRALTEKARQFAEQARPTAAEQQELRQLAEKMAQRAAHEARTEMQRAAEDLRRAAEEMRRATEQMRAREKGAPEAPPREK